MAMIGDVSHSFPLLLSFGASGVPWKPPWVMRVLVRHFNGGRPSIIGALQHRFTSRQKRMMGGSINEGIPKWTVYKGRSEDPIKMDDLGVPLF